METTAFQGNAQQCHFPPINQLSERINYTKSFEAIEREILSYPAERVSEWIAINDEVEKARCKWACITAKSQRGRNDLNKARFEVFENITEFKFDFRRMEARAAPPNRTDSPIHEFSQRSRSRMMKKFKKMQKVGLSLPYFVTLTYQKNQTDCAAAKKNLNTFHQRFRRISAKEENESYRYFWKMEFQKRGAVHFHLMQFFPENMFPPAWQKNKLHYVQLRVSAAWNEIAEPESNIHLKVGTNCRKVVNWDMATGYLSKYMGKDQNYFNPETGELSEWHEKKTGRFWGFSNNFDFSAFMVSETGIDDIKERREILTGLINASYEQFLNQKRDEIKRLKSGQKSKKYIRRQTFKISKQVKKQKARREINLMRIDTGGMIQIDLNRRRASDIITEY